MTAFQPKALILSMFQELRGVLPSPAASSKYYCQVVVIFFIVVAISLIDVILWVFADLW